MLKRLGTFLLLFIVFSKVVFASEIKDQPDKHYLSICALFKDEAKFLREWIEFHRIVGVDHFYLYNNGSGDNYREVLMPYIREGIVTLGQWPDRIKDREEEENGFNWALTTQISAYEYTTLLRKLETKWLVFVDVNEFLVPTEEVNLRQILDRYSDHPGVILSSDFYNASAVNVLPKRKLVIETVEMTNEPQRSRTRTVEKMIFKPDLCQGFQWPPYRVQFKSGLNPTQLSRNEIRVNYYTNRQRSPWNFEKIKDKLHVDSRTLTEKEKHHFLELGFEIEDGEQSAYRFLPALLKKMGL
jgi:hypothetical protein